MGKIEVLRKVHFFRLSQTILFKILLNFPKKSLQSLVLKSSKLQQFFGIWKWSEGEDKDGSSDKNLQSFVATWYTFPDISFSAEWKKFKILGRENPKYFYYIVENASFSCSKFLTVKPVVYIENCVSSTLPWKISSENFFLDLPIIKLNKTFLMIHKLWFDEPP